MLLDRNAMPPLPTADRKEGWNVLLRPIAPEGGTEGRLAELMKRCAAGDHAAFRLLYDAQAPRLYGLALRLLRDAPLASDALQDTFVQIWRNARRYEPDRGSVEAWTTGLLRYRALDLLRRGGREVTGLELPDQVDEAPSALHRLMADAEGRALQNCLGMLDAERRRMLLLAFVDGLSHSELAQQLGQPLGTVKSWIRRSLLALRECLQP